MQYTAEPAVIDWRVLRQDLINDNFHNGRTEAQLRDSFVQSYSSVYALEWDRCIATGRLLSDGVGNAYVVDVWTHSSRRGEGIASEIMNRLLATVPGQHVYLQTDDAVDFYKKLGFEEQPKGLSKVVGRYLDPSS